MFPHVHDLRYNGHLRPFNTKHLCQSFEIASRRLPDAVDGISQPGHAEVTELLIEEWLAQLLCKKGDVFDDRLSDSP